MPDLLVLCTDLDRTVIPNGDQPESPEARPLLRRLAARPETVLVYVSGRDEDLLRGAIRDYALPVPEFAIGDVGTTIYRLDGERWTRWRAWSQEIAPDWQGWEGPDLAGWLDALDGLELQEPEKQNDFKLSYYAPSDVRPGPLLQAVRECLDAHGVRANLIWSIDEQADRGLLDVLPASANKRHAIEFLMREQGFPDRATMFAGDSGNDLDVLVSGLQAVLVRNAPNEVRAEAVRRAGEAGHPERLYVARGGFLGMNGHYAAGVLEGVAHFFPEAVAWLTGGPGTRR
ncbi:Alpha,alpha-trehalose-phosphate synthase (UDP-forming) [Thioalkalivibrio nitratireducens DSM 14787]|uniref:Alpha,alpha-trehalose-phosphate synthase (UDP-forming) n=1 Tax=Thioalkalivibrio nitratireducens (strain DSM 14787 / UNIQEM 213 / ALEN2) TaxID=1255043 RepID=L0E276_THIND|nr:HAD-IIB family hydrolase [Thioalkalivibrio nitratireducens]AGA35352.1 Alpha,alpha-trehalose-phosphate synthase (UDP-forming) [Thioalkalivibrio nitratireducens DSM 14787]